jgi:poly(3-hydroxyalkanoate) synthetase
MIVSSHQRTATQKSRIQSIANVIMIDFRQYYLPLLFTIAGTLIATYSLYILYETINCFFLIISIMGGGFVGFCLGAGIDVFFHSRIRDRNKIKT